MRRTQRPESQRPSSIALASALARPAQHGQFDPSDLLDFLEYQEKAAGRTAQARFSGDGVPASSRACRRISTQGSRQQQIDEQNAQATAAARAARRRSRKRRGSPRASKAPGAASAAPAAEPDGCRRPECRA